MNLKRAFSLIELSIVIIVISILIAASLKTVKIFSNLEAKKIMQNLLQYELAMSNFYAAYKNIPGDMNNASSVISSSISNDGDGDDASDIKSDDEDIYAFEHLYYAELINFLPVYQTNVPVADRLTCAVDGTFTATERLYPTYNIPELLPNKAALAIHSMDATGSDPFFYFVVGKGDSCLYQNEFFLEGVFDSKEMYNIYMKYDGTMSLPTPLANNAAVNIANFNKIMAITDDSGNDCDYDDLANATNDKSCFFLYKGLFEAE